MRCPPRRISNSSLEAPPGDEGGLDGLTRAGEAVLVEEQPAGARGRRGPGCGPRRRPCLRRWPPRGHWLATSCSRCSANLARAAASFSGRCSVGHAPGRGFVPLQDLAGHGDAVHLARAVDEPHDRHHHPVAAQGQLVGDTERAVHLDGALHDVVQHLGGEHLDRRDVVTDLAVVLVLVDLPRHVQDEEPELHELRVGVGDVVLDASACRPGCSPGSGATGPARTSCRAPSGTPPRCAWRGGCGRRPDGSGRWRRPGPPRRAGSRPGTRTSL